MFTVGNVEISVDIAVDIAVDTPSIVDRYSAVSLSHYRPTIDRLSTDHRPTIDRLSTDCRPTIDRLSTAISTAMSTYISVDITHSKQERVAYKLASQEYLACHVTSRCQGLFPPHPFFEEKALGTRLHIVDRPHQLATEANMLNKHNNIKVSHMIVVKPAKHSEVWRSFSQERSFNYFFSSLQ